MCRWQRVVVSTAVVVIAVSAATEARAADPVQNPAQDAAEGSSDTKKGSEKSGEEAVDVPAVQVAGQKEQPKANDPVGTYDQPRWTVRRPFGASRVYVNPAGYAETNIFYAPEFALSEPDAATVETEYEFEIGLGHRLQFDAYLVALQEGGWNAPFQIAEQKFEFRWAFADWGKIWGNPTLYLEWAHSTQSHPAIEPKLLLGGNLSEKAFAAFNLVYETTLGGPTKHEFAGTFGISYLVHDPKLFLGVDVETELELEPAEDKREIGVLAGPSVQWYPLEPVHLGLTTFVGPEFEKEGDEEMESETAFRGLLIAGYEF